MKQFDSSIVGQPYTMTVGQLFTGVASLIREKELAAEAAAQTPATE